MDQSFGYPKRFSTKSDTPSSLGDEIGGDLK